MEPIFPWRRQTQAKGTGAVMFQPKGKACSKSLCRKREANGPRAKAEWVDGNQAVQDLPDSKACMDGLLHRKRP
jgi:hypothetical protein